MNRRRQYRAPSGYAPQPGAAAHAREARAKAEAEGRAAATRGRLFASSTMVAGAVHCFIGTIDRTNARQFRVTTRGGAHVWLPYRLAAGNAAAFAETFESWDDKAAAAVREAQVSGGGLLLLA